MHAYGSSYIDDTLDPLTNFSFALSHMLKDGRESEPSEAAYLYATAIEPAVEYLRASIYSSAALELFREARTSETFPRYSVKRNGTEVYSGDGRSYFDDQLSASTRYTYAVESFPPGDSSSPVTLAVTTFPPYPLPDKAPAPPSGLQGQAYSQSALELFWDRPASTPAVHYHEISRDHQVVTTINGISHVDSGLRAGTTYIYEVVAIDTTHEQAPDEPQPGLTIIRANSASLLTCQPTTWIQAARNCALQVRAAGLPGKTIRT